MPFEQYIETLDPVLMHAGENAPHAYFIPFDADQDARGARESSRRFTLLNGQWEYYPSVRDFTADFDPMTEPLDAAMPVPGVWQMNGYDHIQYTNVRFPFPYDPPYVPADNPCGLYRRRFALDKQPGAVYQLVFEGVDSCLLLWVNGQFIGASQVPHSPAEYDVTAVLVDGENTVCALVTKWSAAKAAITVSPKLFTSPCTMRMPKFITDCWAQVRTENWDISRSTPLSIPMSLPATRNSGIFTYV